MLNEAQTTAIRIVYQKFLEGKNQYEILIYLYNNCFKTAKGDAFKHAQQIKTILTRETYIGKMTYWKSFTKIDGREKKVVINNENNLNKLLIVITRLSLT